MCWYVMSPAVVCWKKAWKNSSKNMINNELFSLVLYTKKTMKWRKEVQVFKVEDRRSSALSGRV